MANLFGYNQLFSVNPELWVSVGKITIGSDGYASSNTFPVSLVAGLQHNGTGDYTLLLSQCWPGPGVCSIATEKASGFGLAQVVSDNIGVAGTLNGEQGFNFQVLDAAGSATDLSTGDSLLIILGLQKTKL